MGKVCEGCGTDNREKAMFCLGCGAKLSAGLQQEAPPPPQVPAQAAVAQADVDPDTASVAPPKGGLGGRLSLLGLLLGAAALAAWFHLHQQASRSQQALPGPVVAVPAVAAQDPSATEPKVPAPAVEPVPATDQAAFDTAASVAKAERMIEQNKQRAQLNQQRVERERRERLVQAQEQARAARELARQREEQPSQRAGNAGLQPAAALPAPAAPPAPPTVARICDQAGNFFTREVCRLRECNKASQASDPICVNFRKMEEANRAREQAY